MGRLRSLFASEGFPPLSYPTYYLFDSNRSNIICSISIELEETPGKTTFTRTTNTHIEQNNISKTINNTLQSVKQLLTNKNIEVQFEQASQEIKAFYDEERIIQVIHNLVSNAIKFCSPKEGKITIKIKENHQDIEVSIHNNGRGIKVEEFEPIFEKFYQSRDQNVKKPIGSGLGLAICKQIIEHHKGKIWAESTEGNGAKFIFTLPNYNTTENQ